MTQAAWIDTKGRVIPVPSGNHASVAYRILEGRVPRAQAVMTLLRKGWVRRAWGCEYEVFELRGAARDSIIEDVAREACNPGDVLIDIRSTGRSKYGLDGLPKKTRKMTSKAQHVHQAGEEAMSRTRFQRWPHLGLAGQDTEETTEQGARLTVGCGLRELRPLWGRKYADVARPHKGAGGVVWRTGATLGWGLHWWEQLVGEVRRSTVNRTVIVLRSRQIPGGEVGQTVTPAEGVFEGGRERTAVIDIIYEPTRDEPTFEVFKENIAVLAEHLCYALAQKKVIVRFADGPRTGVIGVSPAGFPAPASGELERFIDAAKEKT